MRVHVGKARREIAALAVDPDGSFVQHRIVRQDGGYPASFDDHGAVGADRALHDIDDIDPDKCDRLRSDR